MQRRYDVDWMRNIAFLLLIFYHVGMYYVADWDWHVKSAQQSTLLQDVMILTNQWRMSLLFFISGMALSLYCLRRTPSPQSLLRVRSQRLLMPLLLGMLVVVPPQVYYELLEQQRLSAGYAPFYLAYLQGGDFTWNHLWFLPYLWCYSLLWIVIEPGLSRLSTRLDKTPAWHAYIFVILTTMLIWLALRRHFPTTHDLVNDWYSHAKYLFAFLCGSLLVRLPKIWDGIRRARWALLISALLAYGVIIAENHGYPALDETLVQIPWVRFCIGAVLSVNHWGWLLAAVGFSAQHLNAPSGLLRYLTPAILPMYVLHQTLIVIFAVWLRDASLSVGWESLIIIMSTIGTCLLGYEIVKRVNLLRWLFGMPVKVMAGQLRPQPPGQRLSSQKPLL